MLSPDRILYEDNHLLVVCKRAGELAQGDATGDTPLLDLAKAYIRERYQKPGEVFLGLVHRLDRPVSGVLLLARTGKAAARLAEQFRERSVLKIYQAVVEGEPPQPTGALEHWIGGTLHRTRVSISAPGQAKDAKIARLRYATLATGAGRSKLEVTLLTGVKHQIRAQLAQIGCPIVGDLKYDHRPKRSPREPLDNGHAIALHAERLTILHPTQKVPLTFTAPLPPYWPAL